MSKLPREIFITRANQGTKEEFLEAHKNLNSIECHCEIVRVGIYKLVREVEVVAEPKIITEVG